MPTGTIPNASKASWSVKLTVTIRVGFVVIVVLPYLWSIVTEEAVPTVAGARAANRRNNFAHQASRKLVNEYQFIAFEKLDINEMQRGPTGRSNKTVNRGIADVAWGQFVHYTTYKAANAGRGVALVNPRGTTQACSAPKGHPGSIVPKDLSVRILDCPNCGLKISRDLNAALNILARGLASIGAGLPDEAIEAHPLMKVNN